MENASGIRPMWDKVLVKPDEAEAVTRGGIIIPETTKERDQFAKQEGVLVAVGPAAFRYDWPDDRAADQPSVGERVFFSRYQAEKIRGRDGVEYWILKDESIAGVME